MHVSAHTAGRLALTAALPFLLVAALSGCGADPAEPKPRAAAELVGAAGGRSTTTPQPAATLPSAPVDDAVDGNTSTTVPASFPQALPVPEGAEIQRGAGECRLTWLASGAELSATAADVSAQARTNGLRTKHQSASVPGAPVPTVDAWGSPTLSPGPAVETVSFTFSGDVDASLALTVPAPGVVLGEYSVRTPACAS
ncbi:hypothetical protein [Nocardioides yefusunii]|uniref:Lipoprotein n=1 Tax=Nocardioides yefusunii TaxID=2500546 RepID=A0ABW1R1J5_9ACTN|nr:hypothetical protein [Nocardioides yefusunii]